MNDHDRTLVSAAGLACAGTTLPSITKACIPANRFVLRQKCSSLRDSGRLILFGAEPSPNPEPMKKTLTDCLPLVVLGLALCGAQTEAAASAQANTTTAPAQVEDLGHDLFNGKTNKIARVIEATPTHVRVRYENGGERNIPRLDLNSPLKERYHYDAQAAADYLKKQTLSAQAKTSAQRQAWEQRIRELELQLNALDKQWAETHRELNAVEKKRKIAPKSKVLKREEIQLIEQRKELGRRRTELHDKLQAMRKQADALR